MRIAVAVALAVGALAAAAVLAVTAVAILGWPSVLWYLQMLTNGTAP